jgi:hypothetical protein
LQNQVIGFGSFSWEIAVRKEWAVEKIPNPLALWIDPVLPNGLLSIILNHTVRFAKILQYLLFRRRHGQTILKFSCIVHIREKHPAAGQGKQQ